MDTPGPYGTEFSDPVQDTSAVPTACHNFDLGSGKDHPPPGGPSPTVSVSQDDPIFSLDLTQPVPSWVSGTPEEAGDSLHRNFQTTPLARAMNGASDVQHDAAAACQDTSTAFLEKIAAAVTPKVSRSAPAAPGGSPGIARPSQGGLEPTPHADCGLPNACAPQHKTSTKQQKEETAQGSRSATVRSSGAEKTAGTGLASGRAACGDDGAPPQVSGDPGRYKEGCGVDLLDEDQEESCPLSEAGKGLECLAVTGEETRRDTRALLDVQFACGCAYPLWPLFFSPSRLSL